MLLRLHDSHPPSARQLPNLGSLGTLPSRAQGRCLVIGMTDRLELVGPPPAFKLLQAGRTRQGCRLPPKTRPALKPSFSKLIRFGSGGLYPDFPKGPINRETQMLFSGVAHLSATV